MGEMMNEKLDKKEEKMRKNKNKKPKKRKIEDSGDSDSSVEADEQLERMRRETQAGMSRHAGTSKNWNQAERFRSSYANRMVNRGIDDADYVSTSKNITRGHDDDREKKHKKDKKSKKSKKSRKESSENDAKSAKKKEMEKKLLAMMQNATEYQTNREKKAADAMVKQKLEDEAEKAVNGMRKGASFLGDVKIQM